MKNIDTEKIRNRRLVSGALFDFLGYLTTLDDSITLGGSEDCTIALDIFVKWAQKRGLNIKDDPDIINWNLKV